jgi:hypothetical protein
MLGTRFQVDASQAHERWPRNQAQRNSSGSKIHSKKPDSRPQRRTMPVSVDDLVESAASGVLRALNARGNGQDAAALVKSGFNVEFHIRAGGMPWDPQMSRASLDLNPQPEPPGFAQ